MVRNSKFCFPISIQVLCISFILSVAFAAVQYYPAPEITTSTFGPLTVVGNRWIGSKRIESLQVTNGYDSDGQLQATFTIRYYDSTAQNYLSSITIKEKGQWLYAKGTREQNTLSCSVFQNRHDVKYGLLSFNIAKKQLKFVLIASFSQIEEYFSANSGPWSDSDFLSSSKFGQNCETGNYGSSIYLRQTGEFTGVQIVKLPTGWNGMHITEDYKYAIGFGTVYRYTPAKASYQLIYTIDILYEAFFSHVSGNRIIIAIDKPTTIQGSQTLGVQQIFIILQDSAAGVKQIAVKTYKGFGIFTAYLDYIVSPKLNKLILYYMPKADSPTADIILTGFNIDYASSTTSTIEFDEPAQFVSAFAVSNRKYDISDRFIVVRDLSKEVELAYEFVGSKVKKFASRDISGEAEELSSTQKLIIDPQSSSFLTAIIWLKVQGGGYSFKRVFYANYAATVRVKLPSPPPLVKYEMPDSYMPLSLYRFGQAQRSQISVKDGKSILISRIVKIGQTDNLITYTTTFDDIQLSPKNGNTNCMIATKVDPDDPMAFFYYLLRLDKVTKKYTSSDLTTLIGDTVLSNPYQGVVISDTCDKLKIEKAIYYTDADGEFKQVANDQADFDVLALDYDFKYAYTKGSIWKFNSATHKYDKIHTLPQNSDNSFSRRIHSSGNKILIYFIENSDNGRNYIFSAFRDDNNVISPVAEDKIIDTSFFFNLLISPDLTKVILYVGVPQVTDQVIFKLWFINYAPEIQNALTIVPIDYKEFYEPGRWVIYVLLNDFLYARQRGQPKSNQESELNKKEFVYYLKDGTSRQILKKPISVKERDTYKQPSVIISNNGKYYLLNTYELIEDEKKYYVIPNFQLQLNPAPSNLNANSPVSSLVKDGKVYLCEPGCQDCSTGQCISCKTGYVLQTIFSSCKKCAAGCKECDSVNINKCSSCYDGLYKDSFSCLACDPNCATCSTTSTNCDSCVPQQFLDTDFKCKACPKFCAKCSDASTCTTCRNGFILTADDKCRSCSILCSQCLPTSVITCSSCSNGLELIEGKCVQCPANCLTCSNGVCSACATGYILDAQLNCALACQLPCATCATNKPSVCTSCYGSAILAAGKCSISSSCNTDSSCTECGQGLNYYLDAGKCTKCPTIQSCIQCSPNEPTACTLCLEGYYVSSLGACTECGLGCKTCASEAGCKICSPGFLLPASSGICLQCREPCLTCENTIGYCTSCMDGYFRQGWKCLPNKYLALSLTFPSTGDIAAVDAVLDLFIATVLTAINEDVDNIDVVTILSMLSGSVVVQSAITPTGGITSTTASSVTTALSAVSSFGGLTTGSLAVSVYTAQVGGGDSSENSSGSNTGVIVGAVVGSVAFVAIILVVIYCVYASKKSNLLVHSAESSNIIQDNKESIPVESFNGIESYNAGRGYNAK